MIFVHINILLPLLITDLIIEVKFSSKTLHLTGAASLDSRDDKVTPVNKRDNFSWSEGFSVLTLNVHLCRVINRLLSNITVLKHEYLIYF